MDNRLYKALMTCGHAANATIRTIDDEHPYCTICDCELVALEQSDIMNRKAKCIYCNTIVDSKIGLAFYRHKPLDKYDEYYCGCEGWD